MDKAAAPNKAVILLWHTARLGNCAHNPELIRRLPSIRRSHCSRTPPPTWGTPAEVGKINKFRHPPFVFKLFDQVLGQVEAHINSLRAQLHISPDRGAPGNVGEKNEEKLCSSPGCGRGGGPMAAAAAAAAAAAVAAVGGGAAEKTPASVDYRSKHYVPRTPPGHDGNEDGLTEVEDMRLNRLLRSTNSSSSFCSPVALLPSPFDKEKYPASRGGERYDEIGPVVHGGDMGIGRDDNGVGSPTAHGENGSGSHNNTNASQGSRLVDGSTTAHSNDFFHGSTTATDEPAHANHFLPGRGDTLPYKKEDVSRKLFATSPEADRRSLWTNSTFVGGEPLRRSGAGAGAGAGAGKGAVAVAGRRSELGREGDDLEDISDGGFHSGCWRRKYVRGEMR